MKPIYKNIDRFFILFILLSGFVLNGNADNVKPSITELQERCRISLEKRDYHKTHDLARNLHSLSLAQQDRKGLGLACYYLGATEVYLAQTDSARIHLDAAMQIGEDLQNDSLIGMALNCQGIYETLVNNNLYAAQRYFIRAIEYPQAVAGASVNLAQIALMQNDTSGAIYARKTYQYGVDSDNVHYRYIGLLSLVKFAIMKEEVDLASRYLEEMKRIAAQHDYTDTDKLALLEADILMHKGNYTRCNQLLDSIKPDISANHPNQLPNLLHIHGSSLHFQKRYAESNAVLSEAVEVAKSNSFRPLLESAYRVMADNHAMLGNNAEAVKYLKLALQLSEEAAKTEHQRMINERDLTLKLAEEEHNSLMALQSARYSRKISVFLALLLILAAAIIIIVIRNLRRRNRLYRHIVQQNVEIISNEEKYKARIRQLEKDLKEKAVTDSIAPAESISIENPDTESDSTNEVQSEEGGKRSRGQYSMSSEKSRQLFDQLQILMEDRQLFRNPQLTRESVMDSLHTNSTYLGQAIKENTGMSYSQYVNSFRIKEAVRILSDKTRIDDPIKKIMQEAGFNSIATFYKLFQQSIGISPLAFRKSLSQVS